MPFPFGFWSKPVEERPEVGARVRAPRGIRSSHGYVPAGTEGVVRTLGDIGCRVQFEHRRELVLARYEEVNQIASAPAPPLRDVVPDVPETARAPAPLFPVPAPARVTPLVAPVPQVPCVFVLMSNSRTIVAVFASLPTEQAKDAAYSAYLQGQTVQPGIAATNCWVERWPVNGQWTRNTFVNPPRP